jgi:hypothetical protein
MNCSPWFSSAPPPPRKCWDNIPNYVMPSIPIQVLSINGVSKKHIIMEIWLGEVNNPRIYIYKTHNNVDMVT